MAFDLSSMVSAYADGAVAHAKMTFETPLDFSPGSVERVEEILAKLAPYEPGFWARITGRSLEDLAKAYGYYVGEVVIRNFGGAWSVAGQFGTPSGMAIVKGDAAATPIAKVLKRLSGSAEDNVWTYFEVLRTELWPKD
jgi:hypothetical protein